MKDTEETISYKLKIFSSATASKTCTLKISPKTSLKSVRSFLTKYSDYSFYFEDSLFIN